MIEVTAGIYQLPLPLVHSPLSHVNAYLVRGNNGYLLVDSGWNTRQTFSSLQEQVTSLGVRWEDISQIVITHVHPDHYGLAGKVKELSHARVALHQLEKEFIESRYVNMDGLLVQMAQWLSQSGVPPDELASLQKASVVTARFVVVTPPDIILKGGETITTGIFNFKVLWTPGHSPGHVSLYEPERKILISGDYILPGITPSIALHPQQASTSPLDDYLKSLEATRRLEANLILPGHEQPFHNLPARIDEIVEHHHQRKSEILNSLSTGEKTAYDIAIGLTWMPDAGGVDWHNLSALSKRLAVLETLSHLESMRLAGKVDKSTKDGLNQYSRA